MARAIEMRARSVHHRVEELERDRTIASLRTSAAFRTWFYRIVVREAAEIKRRRSRAEPAPDASPSAHDQTARIDVGRALSGLGHKLREVVVLRYFEDLRAPRSRRS